MRLRRLRKGIFVWLWGSGMGSTPERTVARLRNVGVKGTVLVPPREGFSGEVKARLRRAFSAHGLFASEIAQYRYGWALASADGAVMDEGVAAVVSAIRDAREVEAHCASTSIVADDLSGCWSQPVWKRLVKGMREVCGEAERLAVDLAVHPSNQGPLDRPEQVRRLIDDVGSPRLVVMLDVVNMITLRSVHNTTAFLDTTFDLLDDAIVGIHAKDARHDPRHWVVRIDEVAPGSGTLDFATLLKRTAELERRVVLTIEHLRDVTVSGSVASPNYAEQPSGDRDNRRAREFLQEVAKQHGIQLG